MLQAVASPLGLLSCLIIPEKEKSEITQQFSKMSDSGI